MKNPAARFVVASFVLALLGACSSRVTKEEHTFALAALTTSTKFCRRDDELKPPRVWSIYKLGSIDDVVSKPNHSYDIIQSNHSGPPSSSIVIQRDDRIVISKKSNEAHLDQTGMHSGSAFAATSGKLTVDKDRLWASGDAIHDGKTVGTYYVFLLGDRAMCMHSRTLGGPCRQLHFEFFETRRIKNRPEIGVNVFPYSNNKRCVPGMRETDDGDGDEGPK